MMGPYASGDPGVDRTMSRGMNRAGPLVLPLLLLLLLWGPPALAGSGLSGHPSPYLRSHADDPVKWRSPESVSVADARAGDMPFLVLSGYQSCYWCYRFKQDTLTDADLAEVVNGSFVPVLLDREMHTQDDRVLQAFMRDFVGIGGWPATAVVTPDGVPVMAWTFVSAPELSSALETFSRAWADDHAAVRRLLVPGHRDTGTGARNGTVASDLGELLQGFLDQAGRVSDARYGGFGTDSKHPFVPQLLALLDLHQLRPSDAMAAFLRHSLDSMIAGDLVDPVEGGVFRYTENRDWTGPHFEQMLYTQALVARLLFRAAIALERPGYGDVAEGILDNMLARFAAREGWFVSSLSATGEDGVNGAYYLAAPRDLEILLGESWRERVDIRQQAGERLLVAPVGLTAGSPGRRWPPFAARRPWNGTGSCSCHGMAWRCRRSATARPGIRTICRPPACSRMRSWRQPGDPVRDCSQELTQRQHRRTWTRWSMRRRGCSTGGRCPVIPGPSAGSECCWSFPWNGFSGRTGGPGRPRICSRTPTIP